MLSHDRTPVTPTRRSLAGLLAATAVAPAVVFADALPQPAYAADVASPEVAELARLYNAALRRSEAALVASEAAWARYVRPAEPEALFAQSNDPLRSYIFAKPHGGRFWYGDAERIDQLRNWPMDQHTYHASKRARRDEIVAAYDQWRADIKHAEDTAGVTAADAEYKAAWDDEEMPIRQRILELRSAEPAALRLKVRAYLDIAGDLDWRGALDRKVAAAVKDENGPWEDAMALSIIRDVVTVYGQANA